ncbi:MAG: Decaprenylphosphoryl-beta-D-ribose oxidase [Fimbriimonadaceae bacterium]|nr:Decaprenylphosphoryl-beta-D-ribose oxidase [Fimbriimonadaceae bacterium]
MDLSTNWSQVSPDRIVRITGFGMSSIADGYLYRPCSVEEIAAVFDLARRSGRQVVLRGAGRSYGDAAVGAECLILDTSRMADILNYDPTAGRIEVEPGVTLDQIWRYTLEDGWWLPVSSGTAHVTVAGAIAMNIHGKNAFRAGTFGDHIVEIDVLWPTGHLETLQPSSERFRQVVGSAGLLGVITRAVINLKHVASGDLHVLPISVTNLQSQFAAFDEFVDDADYMVSWIDAFGSGKSLGRGLFHAAWYTEEAGNPPASLLPGHQEISDTMMGVVPKALAWRLLKPFNRRLGMRMINWAKYRASKTLGNGRPHPQSLASFMYLLDAVPNWRNAYLPGGFLQYQCFVPKETALDAFGELLRRQQAMRLENYLTVMKRHRPSGYLVDYSVDGFSLAMDFKVTERKLLPLMRLCHDMNDTALAAGGRFYFAKDSTLRPTDVERFLGEETLSAFRRAKREVDPDHLLTSELARRLKLA